jgi:hypothetical protein
MVKGVRTESRSVRPFRGVDDVQALVGQAELLVSEDAPPLSSGSTHQIEPLEFQNLDLRIRLPFAADELVAAVSRAVPDISAVQLVAVTRASLLRRSHISAALPISSSLPERIQVTQPEPELVYRDQTGADVLLAAVLMRELPRAPLMPHLPGTWLGLSRWRIRPMRDFGFRIRELTDEKREEVGLPKGSMTYVSISGDIVSAGDESIADHVTQYVDAALLSRLRTTSSPTTAYLQAALVGDLLLQLSIQLPLLVKEHAGETLLTRETLEHYPSALDLFSRIAVASSTSVEYLLYFAQEEPTRLRPILEDAIGMSAPMNAALGV